MIFISCGGEWTAGDSVEVKCDLSEVPFSSAERLSLSADGESLYILDRYNKVYAYNRNGARVCAFELSRTPENSDGRIPVSMAQEIEKVGSWLYYYDGISVMRYDDEDWACDVSLNAMALTTSYIYYAPSSGLGKLKIQSTGCAKTGTSYSATRVMALDAKSDWIVAVETSGALTDAPQRVSIYDEDGAVKARAALAASDTNNSLHFCSATRVRLGSTFFALLDTKCSYLGVFNLSGGLQYRMDLAEIGARNAVDIDVIQDDLYILTSSTVNPILYLDLASYAFGEE
ncbi:MAG: hypothetical protein J6Z31_08010 [Fibrobacter sp.]|nr:hypothetical protein [Fibrobacter sp.]